MYLSQVFLRSLSNDYSEENLIKTFECCEAEWEKRLQRCKDVEWKCEWRELYDELSDAWDVMKEFLEESEYNSYLIIILRCIGEAGNAVNNMANILRNSTDRFSE